MEAGRQLGLAVDYHTARCLIGMGGGQILPKPAGLTKGGPEGQRFTRCVDATFRSRYLPQVQPFPQARELLLRMRRAGLERVAGSSARKGRLESLPVIASIQDLIQHAVCAAEVTHSRPAPDITGPGPGASRIAAGHAGVACIALRCGGWRSPALAGAVAIHQDPPGLPAHFDASPPASSWPGGGR